MRRALSRRSPRASQVRMLVLVLVLVLLVLALALALVLLVLVLVVMVLLLLVLVLLLTAATRASQEHRRGERPRAAPGKETLRCCGVLWTPRCHLPLPCHGPLTARAAPASTRGRFSGQPCVGWRCAQTRSCCCHTPLCCAPLCSAVCSRTPTLCSSSSFAPPLFSFSSVVRASLWRSTTATLRSRRAGRRKRLL